MASIRRRFAAGTAADENTSVGNENDDSKINRNDSVVTDKSAAGNGSDKAAESYKLIPAKRLERLERRKGTKRRHAWVFILGGLFGLALAALFADNSDIIDLPAIKGMNLESIFEVLPAGFVRDARDLQVCLELFDVSVAAEGNG